VCLNDFGDSTKTIIASYNITSINISQKLADKFIDEYNDLQKTRGTALNQRHCFQSEKAMLIYEIKAFFFGSGEGFYLKSKTWAIYRTCLQFLH
jgi:hypothetical protein